jgi:(1->4)-alpha-D-glucan 1-alpha-D-glucosylmutase
LIYQTLVGAWPLEPLTEKTDLDAFSKRIGDYMLKAMREAKENTSWINQNAAYENAVSSFLKKLLNPGNRNRFLSDFIPFQRRVSRVGLWNSLSQTLLKLASPGVPDIYQGNDLWDLSLVDPDNRRPVDYVKRQGLFDSIRRLSTAPDPSTTSQLLQTPEDGRLKLYLIWKTLCLRKEQPDLFQHGKYVPLVAQGVKAAHTVAFARRFQNLILIVITPRLIATLLNERETPPIGSGVWEDTHIVLPSFAAHTNYQNAFTGEVLTPAQTGEGSAISMEQALAQFPVALLLSA